MIAKKYEKILYYRKKSYQSAVRVLRFLAKTNFLSTNEIADKLDRNWGRPHSHVKLLMQYLVKLDYCKEYGLVTNPDHVCDNCKKSKRYLVEVDSIEFAINRQKENKKSRDKAEHDDDFNLENWFPFKEGYVVGQLIWLQCFGCNKGVTAHSRDLYKILQDKYWELSENGIFVLLTILKNDTLYNFIEKHNNIPTLKMADILLRSQNKEYVERLINSIKQTLQVKPKVMKTTQDWFDETSVEIRNMKDQKILSQKLKDYKKEIESMFISKQLLNSRRSR